MHAPFTLGTTTAQMTRTSRQYRARLLHCPKITCIHLCDLHSNPDSTLINGVGRYSGGPQVPLAVVNVEQGKRFVALHIHSDPALPNSRR